MKKVLFLSAALALGVTGLAQQMSVKAPATMKGSADLHRLMSGKEVCQEQVFTPANTPIMTTSHRYDSFEEFETMITNYDLQANGFLANRMVRWDDNTLSIVATLSTAGTSAAPDRGTGYNYYNGSEFGDMPEARIEGVKTGWPSIAKYGANGEIIVAHTGTKLIYYTRATKGEGEWVGPKDIPNPELGGTAEEMTWPRVITSGPNNDIIHVIAADQDGSNYDSYMYYARSTDGETWTVGYTPELGDDVVGTYSADNYALAANGNTVAMLYTGSVSGSTFLIKSTDNGETWTKTTIWEHPYAEHSDWANDEGSLFANLYMPDNGSIAISNNGIVHCAFSIKQISHEELGTSYNFYYGGAVDGIMYWNETMGQMVSPDNDPHNVCRLWWPDPENPDYVIRDPGQYFVGYLRDITNWSNDNFYHEDYHSYFMGCSSLPAICIDESGAKAIAFSCPDIERALDANNKYYRSIYVSYIDETGTVFPTEDYLQEDIIHMMDECINVCGISNTVNKEFWFTYSSDDTPGMGIGNNATQATGINDNTIWAVKVTPNPEGWSTNEVVNPMTNIAVRPNPVQDVMNLEINASQASNANVTIYNITGQVVAEQNISVSTGINSRSINVENLNSGIYFVTVSANGFQETMKFVVR